jgi:hypothetical protein
MALAHRVKRLERQASAPPPVTFAEVAAASARLERYFVALLHAVRDGTQQPPPPDVHPMADAEVLQRWRRETRTWFHEESNGAHDTLMVKLALWWTGLRPG